MLNSRTPLRRMKPLPRSTMPRRSTRKVAGKNRSAWDERLDDLFRAIVMTLAGMARMPKANGDGWFWYGPCLRCGQMRALYVSHIEPKGQYRHLRWTEGNAFPFCSYCHLRWWHKNPREAHEFRLAQLGTEASDALAVAARQQTGKADYKLVELRLVQRLRVVAPRGIEGLVY